MSPDGTPPVWPGLILGGLGLVLLAVGEGLRHLDRRACRFANLTDT